MWKHWFVDDIEQSNFCINKKYYTIIPNAPIYVRALVYDMFSLLFCYITASTKYRFLFGVYYICERKIWARVAHVFGLSFLENLLLLKLCFSPRMFIRSGIYIHILMDVFFGHGQMGQIHITCISQSWHKISKTHFGKAGTNDISRLLMTLPKSHIVFRIFILCRFIYIMMAQPLAPF